MNIHLKIKFKENTITKTKLSPHHFWEIEKLICNLSSFNVEFIKMYTDNFLNEIHFTLKHIKNEIIVNVVVFKETSCFLIGKNTPSDLKIKDEDVSQRQYYKVLTSEEETSHVDFYNFDCELIFDLELICDSNILCV